MYLRSFLLSVFSFVVLSVQAQSYVHQQSSSYQWPDNPLVVDRLHEWQDLKFGVILHWGLYSVPGICESWPLTSEEWITPDSVLSYDEYKKWYWGLIDKFNPVGFNPDQWAEVASEAGMKYMVFTTKHHDGFCLFDSKQTDFTVTHSAFADNPRSDVARHVFEAFRKKNMMIGCYFSKPDWHSKDYWWDKRATYNRMHNYAISRYPERWDRYKSFVYNQVDELMSGYGKIDILWLDGGWCTAPAEDIDLDSIVSNSRKLQPGLIVVDRACPGKHENYQTPEQTIPEGQLLTPWESCVTLTNDWGWTDHPVFKSPARIIATLAEVVAKGGSLLLGVGPTPEGLIEDGSVLRLRQIGKWLRQNGEAIYHTVPTPVYRNRKGNVWFTANKDMHTLYAVVTAHEASSSLHEEDLSDPLVVEWEGNQPLKSSKMILLQSGKSMKWVTDGNVTRVSFPKGQNIGDGLVLKYTIK